MALEITKKTLTAPAHEVAAFAAQSTGMSGGVIVKPPVEGQPLLPKDLTPTEFEANVSPREKCYRLVHDGRTVIALFESVGETSTRNELFCGTREECDAEIARLGLDRTEVDAQEAERQATRTPLTPKTSQRPVRVI